MWESLVPVLAESCPVLRHGYWRRLKEESGLAKPGARQSRGGSRQIVMDSDPTGGAPAYRRLQRVILALCVLLAPLSLVAWFSVCPPFGDVSCPSQGMATIAAFRAMSPLLHQVFTALNMVAPYAYPVSYIGLGLLAMRGS